jgi:hypothetical protein
VWKDRLGEFRVKHSKHYTLIHDVANEARAEEWLKRLEQNYRGFFYWFVLNSKPLPLPNRRLVAVLVENPDAFERQHKDIFDDVEMVADGFYDHRDNLAIFSASRLDQPYTALKTIVKGILERGKWDENDLLVGKRKRGVLLNEYARAATLVLLKKALEDESERASISHEGTRQLLAAVGLAPRSIELPRWIDFGMASFFETPKGSFWTTIGGPNQLYLAEFKKRNRTRKLDKIASEALKKVVTDWFFHQVKSGPTHDKDLMTARMSAWALTYFLANKKSDELLRYYQELRGLPRDLAFDEEVLLGIFARAFGLSDPTKPNELDANKLAILADQWYRYIRDEVTLEAEESLNAISGAPTKPPAATPPAGSGRPGPDG